MLWKTYFEISGLEAIYKMYFICFRNSISKFLF